MDVAATGFVGVDTHKSEHTAVVIDAFHRSVCCVTTPNHPRQFQAFLDQLQAGVPPGQELVFDVSTIRFICWRYVRSDGLPTAGSSARKDEGATRRDSMKARAAKLPSVA